MDLGVHWALSCTIEKVMIPSSPQHTATVTFVHTRACEDSHQKCMEGTCERVGVYGEPPRGARAARRRSFLHLHLTHFTTQLFRQYNHFNNCLPSSAPPRLLFLLLQFLRSGKMR